MNQLTNRKGIFEQKSHLSIEIHTFDDAIVISTSDMVLEHNIDQFEMIVIEKRIFYH